VTPERHLRQGKWKERPPQERAWRRRSGTSATAEQDRAAGGRHRRFVDLGDGRRARASVRLTVRRNTRRIRATLRWSDCGRTKERYLGEVDHATRKENLAAAWRLAHIAGYLSDATAEEPVADSWATSPSVRAVMRGNRGRDTQPELRLRSLVHSRGYRYQVNAPPVPALRRRADMVFPTERVAVFVDGCFWHGCREHHRPATKNSSFWRDKIEGNKRRDAETNEALELAGWAVVRVWEHEDVAEACERVTQAVAKRRSKARGPRAPQADP
jgi:DNA mismatch endonuclease, patch repair protein